MEVHEKTAMEDNAHNCYSLRTRTKIKEDVAYENALHITRVSGSVKKFEVKSILHSPYFGILYSTLSSVFITFSAVIIKKVYHFNAGQLSLLSNTWIIVGCLPIIAYTGENVFGSSRRSFLAFVRAILGGTLVYLTIVANRYLPIAEVAIIYSTTPSISAIVARIFLKQSCGVVQCFALVLSVIGALLAVRVPELLKDRGDVQLYTTEYIIGLISAVGFVICCAFTYTLLRLTNDLHFSVQLIHSALVGVIAGAFMAATVDVALPYCGWDPPLMLSAGLASFIGYIFITLAVRTEAVAIVTTVRSSSDVLVSLLFQVIFIQHYPDMYNWCAVALVIVSAGLVCFIKWLMQLPNESKLKNKLKCFLL